MPLKQKEITFLFISTQRAFHFEVPYQTELQMCSCMVCAQRDVTHFEWNVNRKARFESNGEMVHWDGRRNVACAQKCHVAKCGENISMKCTPLIKS